jgi:hypothetical protein
MSKKIAYAKTYLESDLAAFPGWKPKLEALITPSDGEAGSGNQCRYYFLHEDFRVTAGIQPGEKVAFEDTSESWKTFCRDGLRFRGASDVERVSD